MKINILFEADRHDRHAQHAQIEYYIALFDDSHPEMYINDVRMYSPLDAAFKVAEYIKQLYEAKRPDMRGDPFSDVEDEPSITRYVWLVISLTRGSETGRVIATRSFSILDGEVHIAGPGCRPPTGWGPVARAARGDVMLLPALPELFEFITHMSELGITWDANSDPVPHQDPKRWLYENQ